jgi:hypothetical protein
MSYKTNMDLKAVEKIYWFLRWFIETDKGAVGKNIKQMQLLLDALNVSIIHLPKEINDEDRVNILIGVLTDFILGKNKKLSTKRFDLVDELVLNLKSENDFHALLFTLEHILIPSNNALNAVPTRQASDIAKSYAENLLKKRGTKGLANILVEWDSITLDISLNRERDIISNLFMEVRKKLETKLKFYEDEDRANTESGEAIPSNSDVILTALVQEFERRLGQKRKQRSGQDLEDATSFIFKFYGFSCAPGPQHFTGGIEVDNWIQDKKGWYFAFSLKRTLRERWKQTVVDTDTLTRHHIRNIIHLICKDRDLTDNKIADMGANRHLFFIADESDVLKRVEKDSVLKDFVYPMSYLIEFLKEKTS